MDVENANHIIDEFIGTINVTYLGGITNDDGYICQKIYKMPIKIEGKEIIAYISVENKNRYIKNKNDGSTPTITVMGWYDLDDPICKENFKRINYDGYYSHSDEKRHFVHDEEEPEEQINLLDVQVPIPYDYVPNENDNPFRQRFNKVNSEIANQIFETKKQYIIAKRKESFLKLLKNEEQRFPEIKLINVLGNLKSEEQEKALSLYDKMIHCIMRGKYSFRDYCTFVRGLPDVVKGKGIFLSEEDEYRMWKKNSPLMTSTFYVPSNKVVAGICPRARDTRTENSMQRYRDKTLDANHGYSSLSFQQLGELGDDEKERYKSGDNGIKIVDAIGNLKPFIVCAGENGEFTIVPEEHKSRYIVEEDRFDDR